jgi:putative tricarboxylic transport membrane protein
MADRVIFVCILILAGIYFFATEKLPSLEIGDPLGPKAFPRLLGIGLIVTAFILLFEMIRGRKPAPASDVPSRGPADRTSYLIVGGVSLWTFLYFLSFERLGFIIATSIYLIALMAFLNRGKWIANVLTAVGFSFGGYFMFVKVLGVNLAPGIFAL